MHAISVFRSRTSAIFSGCGATASAPAPRAAWRADRRASAEVKALAVARAEELGRKAEALQALRQTLLELAERCHGDDRPVCPIIERMSGEDDRDAAGVR